MSGSTSLDRAVNVMRSPSRCTSLAHWAKPRHRLRRHLRRMNLDAGCRVRRLAKIVGRDHLAVLDEHDPVAGDLDLAEQVRVEKHRRAAGALRPEDVAHHAAADRIEPGRRLVEEDEVGLVDDRLREAESLEHSLGESAQATVAMRREPDEIDHLGDAVAALRRRDAAEPAVKIHELGRREPIVESKILGKESDPPPDGDVARRRAEDERAAASRFDEAEQHLDRRALAGAVRSEKAEDLAASDGEREAANRHARSEHLAEILRLDRVLGG